MEPLISSNAQIFNRRGFEDNETNGGQDDWVVSNGQNFNFKI